MTDTASLEIIVDSTQATRASRSLDDLTRAGAGAEQSINRFGRESSIMVSHVSTLSNAINGARSSFSALGPAILGLGFGALANDVLKVNREMQSLRTSLETVTGSASGANAAFKQIQSFAANTPYSVQQVTEAFIKLSNYGLKASEAALTSYGNTASAMGKSLDQMIEAVADAATGQFERLKEFGIKSAKQGENVQFTFHGITTTVKNSSEEIQGYLQSIGNTAFAGGMERQAQTIDGALSNLGDSWNNLLDNIITPGGERMIASLISGTAGGINAIGNLSNSVLHFGDTTGTVGQTIAAVWQMIETKATSTVSAILSTFPQLVPMATSVGGLIADSFGQAWRIVKDLAVIAFNGVVGAVNAMGTAIGTAAAGIVQVFSQAFNRVKDMASGLALGVESALAGDFSFKDLKTAYARETLSFKQVAIDVNTGIKDAMKTDYAANLSAAFKSSLADIKANSSAVSDSAALAKTAGAAHTEAANGVGKHGAAHKGLSDSAKAAKKELQEQQQLLESLRTPSEIFNDSVNKLSGLYNIGKIDLEKFDYWLAKYSDDLQNATASGFTAVTAQEKLNESYKKASDLFAAGKISQPGYAQMLNDATATYDKTANPGDKTQLKALDDYNAMIKQIDSSTSKLGATNAGVFDGALGGINTLTGAFSEMTKAITEATKAQDDLNTQKALAVNNLAELDERQKFTAMLKLEGDYTKANKDLEDQKTQSALTGTRQIIGATASMFDQKSGAAKALHAVETGIAVAQLAMDAKKIASNAVKTVSSIAAGAGEMFAQGGWLGFAGVAAMMAVMAGLGFSGGGGGGSVSLPSPDTGSVLGDSSKQSESIKNVVDTLNNIHASEYRELKNLNSNFLNLAASIESAVASVFQTGGFKANLSGIGKVNNLSVSGGIFSDGILGDIANFIDGALFGSVKTTVKELGIATNSAKLGDIPQTGVNPQQYQVNHVKETGAFFGLFGGDSYDTAPTYTKLNDQITFNINEVFKSAARAFADQSKILGGSFDSAIKNYILPALQIDLKDLNGDDATKKLSAVINTALDNAANSIFEPLRGYQKIGEGMFQTVSRLSIDLGVFKDSMTMAGVPVKSVTLDTVAFSEEMIKASGDIKTMRSNFEDFFSKFYSDGAKFGYQGANVIGILSDMGKAMPGTRDGWRALVQQTLAQGTAAADTAAQLLKINDAADKYYTYLQKATDTFLALGTKLNGSLWGNKFSVGLAQNGTDNALNAFNAAAGTQLNRAMISGLYADQQAMIAFGNFVKNNPVLGGLAMDVLSAYNTEMEKTRALTDQQTSQLAKYNDLLKEYNNIGLTDTQTKINAAKEFYDTSLASIVSNYKDGLIDTAAGITQLSTNLQVFQSRLNAITADIVKANAQTLANNGKSQKEIDIANIISKYQVQQVTINAADAASKQQAQAAYNVAMAGVNSVKSSINSWLDQFSADPRAGALKNIISSLSSSSDFSNISNFFQSNLQSSDFAAWFNAYSSQLSSFDSQLHQVFGNLEAAISKYSISVTPNNAGVDNTHAMTTEVIGYFKTMLTDASTLKKSDYQNALDGVTEYVNNWAAAINLAEQSALSMATSALDKATISAAAQVGRDQLLQVQQAKNDAIYKQYRAPLDAKIYELTHSAADNLAHTRQLELDAMDASLRPLQSMVNTLQDLRDAATKTQDAIKNASSSLDRLIANLQKQTVGGQSYTQAQSLLQTTLASAMAGNFDGLDKAVNDLGVLANDQSKLFATAADYQRAQQSNINTLQIIKALATNKVTSLDTISIPGFASGGYHSGGYRIVGENGPELEYTGPSHISNNGDTKKLFDVSALVAELKSVKEELKTIKDQQAQLGVQLVRHAKKTADLAEKTDIIGPAPTRAAA